MAQLLMYSPRHSVAVDSRQNFVSAAARVRVRFTNLKTGFQYEKAFLSRASFIGSSGFGDCALRHD
jgi:hypothetical protein